jgi:hypothetical protein
VNWSWISTLIVPSQLISVVLAQFPPPPEVAQPLNIAAAASTVTVAPARTTPFRRVTAMVFSFRDRTEEL